MGVGQRRQPSGVLVGHLVSLGAELVDGGAGVAGVPQHHGVQDQAERAKLVFLAFPVGLAQLAALAVEDLAGEPVQGFLDGEYCSCCFPVCDRAAAQRGT